MQHGDIRALDPPGRSDRRWRCVDCGAEGTREAIDAIPCPAAPVAPYTVDEQLARWVAGESVHNDQGDCCPDFSCCRPSLAWPIDQRRAFVDHPEARDAMCMMSLAAAMKEYAAETKTKTTVHIIGGGFEKE